jgi:hypothetical protein
VIIALIAASITYWIANVQRRWLAEEIGIQKENSMSLKLLHEPESDDPILSVVNIIDIFLVIIAALLYYSRAESAVKRIQQTGCHHHHGSRKAKHGNDD